MKLFQALISYIQGKKKRGAPSNRDKYLREVKNSKKVKTAKISHSFKTMDTVLVDKEEEVAISKSTSSNSVIIDGNDDLSEHLQQEIKNTKLPLIQKIKLLIILIQHWPILKK